MSISAVFAALNEVDCFFWSYIGFSIVCMAGLYFSIKSGWFQIKVVGRTKKLFHDVLSEKNTKDQGVSPLKLYFASIGGMVGLGNIVAVVTALLIGGPGALFWIWVASIFGMVIKYIEVYLGIKYRVKNNHGGYDGGPMYYMRHAFSNPFLKKAVPLLICFLLCIYGVEVYQFTIIADTLDHQLPIDKMWIVLVLLVITLYVGFGGVSRLANVCTVMIPPFIILYVGMCFWVLFQHGSEILPMLSSVFKSAFTGHAAIGGFAGSTFLMAAQQGVSRSVYSGDIAIAYDSIIFSETRSRHPERQAQLAIIGVLSDTIFCTMSILVVMVTGVWQLSPSIPASECVSYALAQSFPGMNIFMTIFIFLSGWTTIIGYFAIGVKCARYISPKYGYPFYILYAALSFFLFSYMDQEKVLLIMSISGGLIMSINLIGILRLRDKVKFLK